MGRDKVRESSYDGERVHEELNERAMRGEYMG